MDDAPDPAASARIVRYHESPRCRALLPYNHEYPAVFAALKEITAGGLSVEHTLDHVGSTSVPGLDAKPMIDLLLRVSAERWPVALVELARLGYHGKPTPADRPDKPVRCCAVVWRGTRFNVNLHMTAPDNPAALELIYFRDRLRADRALADEYARIKRLAYGDGSVAPPDYNATKYPFIRSILDARASSGDATE